MNNLLKNLENKIIFTAWLKEKRGIVVQSESLEEAGKEINISLLVMNNFENKKGEKL